MARALRLGVNIDHVATVRNARGGQHPDPVRAATLALDAGADGITVHLREDRRHIRDEDLNALMPLCRERQAHLNLEMAMTDDMLAIARHHRPPAVCIVPEKREERTTEGGLDLVQHQDRLRPFIHACQDFGARVSLFIEPDSRQVDMAKTLGADVIELHTGAYCLAADKTDLLSALQTSAKLADRLGLEVHAGHGLDYQTVGPVAAIPELVELNIGHFLIGEAIFTGLPEAIAKMRQQMQASRS